MLLAACAALGPPAPTAPAFDLIGRVAVAYDGRAFFSNLRWRHAGGRDEIWLLTPAGQTLAHIVGDAEGATITGSGGDEYRADSVEALTRSALGWELPVGRLSFWVQGGIAPGSAPAAVERDAAARLVRLAQDGWRIAWTHGEAKDGETRPRRIELASGTTTIRLVIDDWR